MAGPDPSDAWTQIRSVLRVLLTVLGVLAGLWLIYALAGVLALLLLSVFFAYVLAPGVARRRGVPPASAAAPGRGRSPSSSST